MTLLVFNIVTSLGFFYSWRKQTATSSPTAELFSSYLKITWTRGVTNKEVDKWVFRCVFNLPCD